MPGLLDIRTGERVEVADGDVAAYVESGAFEFDPAASYRLRNPRGVLVDVAGSTAAEAIQNMGFRIGSEPERTAELQEQAKEEYYTSTGQQILTGVEGFLGGATFGITRLIAGDKEGQRERQARNAPISTASSIVGAVGPALLSGGAGAAGTIARLTPAGRAAAIAAKIAGEGSIARATAAYGLEGAVYSTGNVISDIALDKQDLSAEAFLGEVPMRTLLSGGLGAAFTGIGKAAKLLRKVEPDARLGTLGETPGLEPATSATTTLSGSEAPINAAIWKAEKAAETTAARAATGEAKAAARAAKAEQRLIARQPTIREQADDVISADKIIPKHERGAAAVEKQAAEFERASVEQGAIGDELAAIADGHIAIGALNPRGPTLADDLRGRVAEYRRHAAEFDAWKSRGGGVYESPAGNRTLVIQRAVEREADDLVTRGLLSADDAAKMKGDAAYQFAKGQSQRERAAAAMKDRGPEAAKQAAKAELPVYPQNEMRERLKQIDRIGKRISDRARIGKQIPDSAELGAASRAEDVASSILGAEKPPTVRLKATPAKPPGTLQGIGVGDRAWTLRPREMRDALNVPTDTLKGLGSYKLRRAQFRRPEGMVGNRLPLVPLERMAVPLPSFTEEFVRAGKFGDIVPGSRAANVAGDIWGGGRSPTLTGKSAPKVIVDEEFASAVDAIANRERATHDLYNALKPHLDPAVAQRMAPHFEKYGEAVKKMGEQRDRFATFKDAIGALELVQSLGLPGVPDIDKLPVIGPMLSLYLKGRFIGRKLGFFKKTADAAVAEKATSLRNRLSDGVDSFLRTAAKGKRAAVPTAATILSSPLFEAEPKTKGPKALDMGKVKAGMSAAAQFKLRESELRRAQAVGVEAFRRNVHVSDPKMQKALESAWTRRIDFLVSKLPTNPDPPNQFGIPSLWQPSPAELHKYAQFVRGATQFSHIMDDMTAGILTPEAVEAFAATAPELYNELRSLLISRSAELGKTTSYSQRIKLSILYKAPIDPTMAPEYIATQQEGYARDVEQPQPPTASYAGPQLSDAAMWGPFQRAGK